jgi:hypothetical protein
MSVLSLNQSGYIQSNNISESDEQFVDASHLAKPCLCPLFIAKIIGLIKDFLFTVGTFFSRFEHMANYGKVIWNGPGEKKGIVVLIHGLNASPSQMDGHAEAFKEQYGRQVMIYQVQVEKKGNCSKAAAVKPITEKVLSILRENPQMKLYAHGISNGGRLASQLAIDLLKKGVASNRMMVNSNSAPLYGTKVMCDPTSHPIKQKVWKAVVQSCLAGRHCEEIYRDFTWGSKSGKQMIQDIRNAAAQGVRFEFDGGFADSKVTPPSFFPKDVFGAAYHTPSSIQGHSSIIGNLRANQVASAAQFLGLSSSIQSSQ